MKRPVLRLRQADLYLLLSLRFLLIINDLK